MSSTSTDLMVAITHHGHDDYTDLCLKSLASAAPGCCIVVHDDGSPEPYPVGHSLPHLLVRNDDPIGVNEVWNEAVRAFLESYREYLLISNNDVLFTPGFAQPMIDAFQIENVGIVGPYTNQPGHQPAQQFGYPRATPADFFEAVAKQPRPLGVLGSANYVNGFCFMLKRDRLNPAPETWHEGMRHVGPWFTSPAGHPHYEGEDYYQRKMRGHGRIAVIAQSYVYHFKDVTLESWRQGRMGLSLEDLPPRLQERGGAEATVSPGPPG